MCTLFLALALSYHISLVETRPMNMVHPNSGVTCSHYEAGVFYNSERAVSVYMGRKLNISPYSYIEVGAVSGYRTAGVLPYIRYINGRFFIFPTIYSESVEIYTGGNYAITWKRHPMVVLGINIRSDL